MNRCGAVRPPAAIPLALGALILCTAAAQTPCTATPTFQLCELVFELDGQEAAAHPNPYLTVSLHAELRSPRHRTFLLHAFWDGGRRLVIRMAPTEPGEWDYRLTSNISRFSGQSGRFTANDSGSPGFIKPANVQHWSYTAVQKPHLWMGDTMYRFATMDQAAFDTILQARAAQKFNHIRGLILGEDPSRAFPAPDRPNPDHFRQVDQRVTAMNERGIIADLILGGDQNQLANLFPNWQQRERYLRYVVSRYSAMNVTWQLVQEFEEYENGRALMKELGGAMRKMDPYNHPRTTHTVATSGPLAADGWMDHILYQSSDDHLAVAEGLIYTMPRVNAEFGYEDSGAGRSHPHHGDTDTFRKRLWNATMSGLYPTFGNTGTYGGRQVALDAKYAESPGAKLMTSWFEFFLRTRYWDLRPHFEVDGGRALAVPGIEYIVYVEKPGPIEMATEKHGYDTYWFNPRSGELRKEKKNYDGRRFTGEPPDSSGDWVLHLSRDGRKEGMLRSYRFDYAETPILMQEIEQNPKLVPFEIVEPAADELTAGQPVPFAVKLKRETRATRTMLYSWSAESTADGLGYRVLGGGAKGTFRIPAGIATRYPAVLNLRVTAVNANGKVYTSDRVYRLNR
ncbi:MAG: DUF4038 domain-containing protein [Bryobacteraceae bacterium]